MNTYIEYMVKKDSTILDIIKRVSIITLAFIIFFIFMNVFPNIGFILSSITIILGYNIYSSINIEYEYTLLDSNIDIEKIIDKKKRKTLASIDLNNTMDFGIYSDSIKKFSKKDYNKIIHAYKNILSKDNFYITINHSKFGKTLVIFSPTEDIISAINTAAKKRINI